MRHVYQVTSWFFGCLAIALLGVATLAVPVQTAFAYDVNCGTACEVHCDYLYEPGTGPHAACIGSCLGICNNPGDCVSQCDTHCQGAQDYNWCMSSCQDICIAANGGFEDCKAVPRCKDPMDGTCTNFCMDEKCDPNNLSRTCRTGLGGCHCHTPQ